MTTSRQKKGKKMRPAIYRMDNGQLVSLPPDAISLEPRGGIYDKTCCTVIGGTKSVLILNEYFLGALREQAAAMEEGQDGLEKRLNRLCSCVELRSD